MEQFERFKDAPWYSNTNAESVMIGGAGGIGSWLTFFISRAGFKPILYDFDRIEAHNLGGQLFKSSDIGLYKVEAVRRLVKDFCDTEISILSEPITRNSPYHYFMFSAFDNMEARKIMFDLWKKSHSNCPVTPLYIDGRLEAEQLQIFCVTPENMHIYEERFLFEDSLIEDLPCSFRQTSHTAAMIAAHMTGFFTNHITNINERETVRSVPFYYEYFIPIDLTENTPVEI